MNIAVLQWISQVFKAEEMLHLEDPNSDLSIWEKYISNWEMGWKDSRQAENGVEGI